MKGKGEESGVRVTKIRNEAGILHSIPNWEVRKILSLAMAACFCWALAGGVAGSVEVDNTIDLFFAMKFTKMNGIYSVLSVTVPTLFLEDL